MASTSRSEGEAPARLRRGPLRACITALAAVALTALATACVPLPRYRSVEPRSGEAPVPRIAERLDPWLLAGGLADEVVVEVDWVEGCAPAPLTLRGLARVLAKYGPAGRPVRVERGDEIPRRAWDDLLDRGVDAAVAVLVERYAGPAPPPGTERRYALFAPGTRGHFGFSSRWWVERDGALVPVSGVVVFREAHAALDYLWVSLDEIERMTLVHEFGHQLGLVADPRHERRDAEHRLHCTRLDCVMAHPTRRLWWRNIWRGVFDVWFRDYCPECRREIRVAQAEWRRQRERDPAWATRVHERRVRAAEEAALHRALWPLVESGDGETLLAEVERHAAGGRHAAALAAYRIRALAISGRIDEAVGALERLEGVDAAERAVLAQAIAEEAIVRGRHAAALGVLARTVGPDGDAPQLDDRTFARVTYPMIDALTGLRRHGEAAEAMVRIARRAPHPERWEIDAAELFRRAGDLARAERILLPLHRSRRTRFLAAEAVFRLRIAQGRPDEAREILERAVARPPSGMPAVAGAWPSLVRARRLARLGRSAEAVEELATAESRADGAGQSEALVTQRAEVLAALGKPEQAVELLRRTPPGYAPLRDPCGLEWTEPLRARPEFRDVFGHCPSQAAGGS